MAAGLAFVAAACGVAAAAQRRRAAAARAALAAVEEERRLLLESVEATPTPFALYDADDRLVACNASYRNLHGPAFAQLSQPIHYRDLMMAVARRILPPEEVEAAVRDRVETQRAADGTPKDREYPGGLWYRVHKIRTPSGAIAGLASDITELKRREAELLASEKRLRDFAETASDWFWETDAEQRIVFVSDRLKVLGLRPDQWLGRTLAQATAGLCTEDSKTQTYLDLLSRCAAFRDVQLKIALDDDTARYISLSAVPVSDGGGAFAGYRGVGRDVTAAVVAAKTLQEALVRAEVASRAKSRFLANMSHELRTPLNAIIGFSELMTSGILPDGDSARYRDYAGDILSSGRHLLELINDLLDLAKIEAGKMELLDERIDLDALFAEVARMMGCQAARAGVRLDLSVDEDARYLTADERSIRQIVINLISNAVKFTPAGGAVRICARRRPGGAVTIAVRDTGIGIAAEDISKLMQPFAQLDSANSRRQGGTGLGLMLVRTLAELHGGKVRIRSQLGEGTSVSVKFPAWRGETARAEPARVENAA